MKYIEHHGILGQKWGVRRYQNKDGSLTSAGKRHVKESSPKEKKGLTEGQKKAIKVGAATLTLAAAATVYATNPAVKEFVNNNVSKTINSVKDSKVANVGKTKVKEILSKKNDNKVDLSKISNQELVKQVKRMKLENQYRNLTAKPSTHDKIRKAIAIGGTIATAESTALNIYNNTDRLKQTVKNRKNSK